jgi:hypothetical protein
VKHKNECELFDESAKAHIFLGLLSYWIVNTIKVQLMRKGIRHDRRELTRIMPTQKAVTTCALNKLVETVRIRTCAAPEEKLQGLYDALRYKSHPYKRKKSVVPKLNRKQLISIYFAKIVGKLG